VGSSHPVREIAVYLSEVSFLASGYVVSRDVPSALPEGTDLVLASAGPVGEEQFAMPSPGQAVAPRPGETVPFRFSGVHGDIGRSVPVRREALEVHSVGFGEGPERSPLGDVVDHGVPPRVEIGAIADGFDPPGSGHGLQSIQPALRLSQFFRINAVFFSLPDRSRRLVGVEIGYGFVSRYPVPSARFLHRLVVFHGSKVAFLSLHGCLIGMVIEKVPGMARLTERFEVALGFSQPGDVSGLEKTLRPVEAHFHHSGPGRRAGEKAAHCRVPVHTAQPVRPEFVADLHHSGS